MTKTEHDFAAYGREGKEKQEASRESERRAFVEQLPPLDGEANAKLRLAAIQQMALLGLISGSQAGSAVRAVEVYLKARQAEIDRTRVRDLEKQLEQLAAQLSAAKARR